MIGLPVVQSKKFIGLGSGGGEDVLVERLQNELESEVGASARLHTNSLKLVSSKVRSTVNA